MIKILIAEDDQRIAQHMLKHFEQSGTLAVHVNRVSELVSVIESEPTIHIFILDRLLQSDDTLSLLPLLRRYHPDAGVLFVSALNSISEKANALDAGADDYLGKPFSFVEFGSRVKALERRASRKVQSSYVQFGDIMADVAQRQIHIKGMKWMLPNKEFLVLKTLIENSGKITSRQDLFERAWDMNSHSETNVVEVAINALRKKLSESQSEVRISNLRNAGYFLEKNGDS